MTQQPLSLPPDRKKHNAGPELQAAFRRSLETLRDDFSSELWLRRASWWLTKSRTIVHVLGYETTQGTQWNIPQDKLRWNVTVSVEQAYVDLLKSSWILEEVVLANASKEDYSHILTRRMIKELIRSLNKDLQESRRSKSKTPEFDGRILSCDTDLLESFQQVIETVEEFPNAMDDLSSPGRWFEIDQGNAGEKDEKLIFRTFVNAQLGSKDARSKSCNAPYMLVLWTGARESELFISLCNQRGTVNLSRRLVEDDIENVDQASFPIEFPSQDAEINFQSSRDALDFFALPRRFIAAMRARSALPDEIPIYQTTSRSYSDSSQSYHGDLTALNTVSPKSPCGLRIYQSLPQEIWKTTRRLVVHSPPDSDQPWCISHWLPLDHIRLFVE